MSSIRTYKIDPWLLTSLAFFTLSALPAQAQDWTMWGGTPDRNMVSSMKNLPTEWDVKTNKNVKWHVDIGSQSYGNPVVSGGTVFLGTNNENPRNPEVTGDKGILMALRESDGEFLWQHVSHKLSAGRVNDWPFQGICSSPLVEGDRLYYVSSRCEVSLSRHERIHGWRKRWSFHGRGPQVSTRWRCHLEARHDGRTRCFPA